MGLEIRLRHALGERTLELPPRPAEAPVVVGRASDADVAVPSVNVAPRHCVLFVHEGRWVLQDAGSETGTFVNRRKIEGPTFLQVGDVIALGTEPKRPKIEIDPNGGAAGRTGYVLAAAREERPAVARPATPPPAPVPQVYPQEHDAPASADPYAYAVPAPAPADEWDGLAAAASSAVRTYRRPQQSSGVGLVVGTLATVAILGGAGWLLYKRLNQPAQVIVIQQSPAAVALPATLPAATTKPATAPAGRGMFEFGGLPPQPKPPLEDPTNQLDLPPPGTNVSSEFSDNTRPPPPATKPSEDGGAPPGAVATGNSKPPAEEPPANDPAWKSVEGAYYSRDPAMAVLQFDAYAESNPGKMPKTLAAYTDAAADRIWWERIDQLLDHRKAVAQQIAKLDKEIKEETNASYKTNTLGPERQKLVDQLNRIQQELKEMNWASDNPPPLFDEEELARHRRDRDAKYYEEWKAKVLRHIRRTHGQYPWANEK